MKYVGVSENMHRSSVGIGVDLFESYQRQLITWYQVSPFEKDVFNVFIPMHMLSKVFCFVGVRIINVKTAPERCHT